MKYLGIDYGLKKIGLAISEGLLASPWQVLHISSRSDALSKIKQLIKKEQIDTVVIGLPDSGIRAVILKFALELKKEISVELVDETLSSKSGQDRMLKLGVGKKKRAEEDAYSAAEILQQFLDDR